MGKGPIIQIISPHRARAARTTDNGRANLRSEQFVASAIDLCICLEHSNTSSMIVGKRKRVIVKKTT